MSRVSEALRRAGEERAQPSPQAAEEALQRVEEAEDGEFVLRTNGRPPLIPSPESDSEPKRRLLDRIEELLFGWNLRLFKNHALVALEKSSAAGEQYKIFREQLRKICGEREARVLAVTSPIKGDGKTSVTANLAAVMALDYDERVLLIDGDLRNSSLGPYFGTKASPGLSDYLSSNGSKADLMGCVQSTALPGLRILAAGTPSSRSSELLATEKMTRLLKALPLEFPGHRIIIDTSPVLSTPDPLVLAREVDGIILVVRAGKTPRDCVSEALKSLGSNKVLGIVLNGAELGLASKYYYYSKPAYPRNAAI